VSSLDGNTAALCTLGALMRRRKFIGPLGATALSIPRPGRTQTRADLPLVGLVPYKSEGEFAKVRAAALRKGLQEERGQRRHGRTGREVDHARAGSTAFAEIRGGVEFISSDDSQADLRS
jgi:hypothetical protein